MTLLRTKCTLPFICDACAAWCILYLWMMGRTALVEATTSMTTCSSTAAERAQITGATIHS
jgi:hypothetical protein